MSIIGSNILAGASGGAGEITVDDVFSIDLYTGNAGTQTITNDINLSGEGGLVWIKSRSSRAHYLFDTARGVYKKLESNASKDEGNAATTLTAFNSDGFTIGSNGDVNTNSENYVAWTFRKAPGFLDVVTYTGNGTAGRTVSHNLEEAPGVIICKSRSYEPTNWAVYFKARGADDYWSLNVNSAGSYLDGGNSNFRCWNKVSPTSTEFTLGSDNMVNRNGETYVAYLFGEDMSDVIKCSSYTGTGGSNPINVGFQPQFVLIKNAFSTGNWIIIDDERNKRIYANTDASEATDTGWGGFSSTGFTLTNAASDYNSSGGTYFYIAIADPT